MKTENNIQRSIYSRVKVLILQGAAAIFGLVFISLALHANGLNKPLFTNSIHDKLVMELIQLPTDTPKANIFVENAGTDLQMEDWMNKLEYRAQDFIEPELKLEIENSTNASVDFTFQSEALTNNAEYHAQNLADEEMTIEIQNRQNANTENSGELVEAEIAIHFETLITNLEYNARDFAAADMATEIENDPNTCEAELACQIEGLANQLKYDASEFVGAEINLEIEKRFANENGFKSAEEVASVSAEAENYLHD